VELVEKTVNVKSGELYIHLEQNNFKHGLVLTECIFPNVYDRRRFWLTYPTFLLPGRFGFFFFFLCVCP
jgi:hypothetical protein